MHEPTKNKHKNSHNLPTSGLIILCLALGAPFGPGGVAGLAAVLLLCGVGVAAVEPPLAFLRFNMRSVVSNGLLPTCKIAFGSLEPDLCGHPVNLLEFRVRRRHLIQLLYSGLSEFTLNGVCMRVVA